MRSLRAASQPRVEAAVLLSLLLLPLLPLLAACSSTGVGNPGQVTLAIASADEPPSPAPTPEPESGALLRAVVVLAELRLVPCTVGDPPLRFPGPFVADLVAGTLVPRPPPLEAMGSYCGLEAPLAPALRPASLAGRSVLLHGRRADGVEVLLYAALRARCGRARGAGGWRWARRARTGSGACGRRAGSSVTSCSRRRARAWAMDAASSSSTPIACPCCSSRCGAASAGRAPSIKTPTATVA
ncbi:MAG: hypothetical protein IPG96_11400 [Proteobacteria bacterium]|nr:hypothetical protein [Pseudomonadota bacterium]